MANWSYYPTRRYTGRRSFNPYYNTAYKNTRTRTSRRKANRESWAARQQKDAATVTISRIATVPVVISNGYQSAAVAINHWDSLRLSSYFNNYAPMYDQMKLDKIRMKLTGNQAGTAQTSNLSPAVVLAFDRNGLSPSQEVSTATISTYSSAQLKQWSTGNAFVMYQTFYPSTIMEKGQYIPTDSLLDPSLTANQVSQNPAYNLSDPTLPFKPISMLGVDLGISAPSNQTFAFTVEFEYTVTFRGMRKPSLSYDIDFYSLRLSTLNYQGTVVVSELRKERLLNTALFNPNERNYTNGSMGLLVYFTRVSNILFDGSRRVRMVVQFNGTSTPQSFVLPANSYYFEFPDEGYYNSTDIAITSLTALGGERAEDLVSLQTLINAVSMTTATLYLQQEDLPEYWWGGIE